MKWIALVFGTVLIGTAWLIVQVGKGVLFAHSGHEQWDEAFLSAYRDCCLLTDLRAATPFGVLGLAIVVFAAWKFVRN
jgi:hypothetical protein